MATLEQTAILFLTENVDTKPSIFSGFGYRVYEVNLESAHHPPPAGHHYQDYDVIVFHGMPNADDLNTIQKQYPATPTLVLLEQLTTMDHHELMQLNVDDVLTSDLNQREVERRIQWAIKRHQNKFALTQRRDHLQTITTLLQYMQTQDSVLDIMATLNDLFGLQASVIFPMDPTGVTRILKHDAMAFTNAPTYMQEYDPFMQVIEMGKSQYYRDIVAHPYYTPLPTLENPKSVIITPIAGDDPTMGAVALFAQHDAQFSEADIATFEIFAKQLALTKPKFDLVTHADADHGRLLPIWQHMIDQTTAEDIIQHLHRLSEDHDKVQQALIWIDMLNEQSGAYGNPDVAGIFEDLNRMGYLQPIFEKLHHSLEPILMWRSAAQDEPERQLFAQMGSECIVVFPIVDSARLIGLLIIGTEENRFLDDADLRALENLVFAGGQAIERKTFTHLMHEEGTRLEAILHSISEGTFFVDENDVVTFCNPQFTELTGIVRSRILNQSSENLISQLAQCAEDQHQTYDQLTDALANLSISTDYYPIVTITSADKSADFVVEIAAIDTTISGKTTWAGIVRPRTQAQSQNSTVSKLISLLAQHAPTNYTDVETIVQKMMDSRSRLTPKTTSHFVRKLDNKIHEFRAVWDNFLEIVRIENGQSKQDLEDITLDKLVEYACDTPQLTDAANWIQINTSNQIPTVHIDMLQTTQALSTIIATVVDGTSPVNIDISTHQEAASLRITVERPRTIPLSIDQFTGHDLSDTDLMMHFSYQLAMELMRHNGGEINTQYNPDIDLVIYITMPVTHVETLSKQDTTQYLGDGVQTSIPPRPAPRTAQTIAVLTGQSELSDRLVDLISDTKYDLLICSSTEELLQDIGTIRIDLIVLDADLPDSDSLQTCQMVRTRTAVPIIMLSDSPSLTKKLKAFELEVDEYFEQHITDLEIMARIETLFNRTQMPDRVSEPIKISELYINLSRREVLLAGDPLELTRIEYDLLRYLAINVNQVLEHEQLLAKVWGPEYRNEKHYLWVNISRLRKKLEPNKDSQRYIFNRPGIGYMLRTP